MAGCSGEREHPREMGGMRHARMEKPLEKVPVSNRRAGNTRETRESHWIVIPDTFLAWRIRAGC